MKEYKCTPSDSLGRIGIEFPDVKFKKKRFDLNLIGKNIIGIVKGKKYVCFINSIELFSDTQVFEIEATIISEVNEPSEPEKEMKKVTDLVENEVIHCPTEKEAIEICQLMHDSGMKWCSGESYLTKNNWDHYNDKMCYHPNDGTHGGSSWFIENGHKIHQASDFLKPEPSEPKKPIDKVTVELLDISLRLCGIEIHKSIISKLIDVFELVSEKGGKATVDDFEDLKANWKTK